MNAMIRLAKRKYFRNKFRDARFDIKKTWSLVNSLSGAKTSVTNKDSSALSNFTTDGQTTVEDFNKFFF